MKKLRTVFLDVDACEAYETEIEDKLDSYLEMLKCRCFDVVRRKIDGKWYIIVVDDEGLFVSKPIQSAQSKTVSNDVLVGNLLILKDDGHGCFTSLSENEVNEVLARIMWYIGSDLEFHKILMTD